MFEIRRDIRRDMLNRYQCSERGFTLVETLIGIVVMATVGATLLFGTYTLIKSDESARIHMGADSLARYELEYVKAMTYLNAPWSYELPGTPPSWDLGHNDVPSSFTDYTVVVSASGIAGGDDDIQKISAVVCYKGTQILQVDTYRTK